jgi:gamma-glutamyl phosphate reductase
MFAVFVTVTIAQGQAQHARQQLHDQVLPRVKQTAGLVKGYWSQRADGTQGASMVVFDSKAHADAAAEMVRHSPPPAGVTMTLIEVREVVGEV